MVISTFYPSSPLAVLGIAIISLAAILLYVTPVKHVPLTLLNASAEVAVAEIERLISELSLTERGIYIPPQNLKSESSLVFIPEATMSPSPDSEETNGLTGEKTGVLITPPGAALSRLFEKELGFPFTNNSQKNIQKKLQKVLVRDMGLAESADIQVEGNIVTLKIVGSVLDEICHQTDLQPRTHMQVGCLLSSAFACILAKITEKPVTIQSETRSDEALTVIDYQIFEKKSIQYENMELTPLLCSEMPLGKMETTRLKTLQPKSSIGLDSSNGRISGFRGRTKINFSESGSDSLEIEVASCIIDYLEKNGEVFILADIENPQYSYSKISGYDFDVDLRINFEKFVTISKTSPNVDRLDSPGMEFAAKTFGLSLDEQSEYCLASYAEKSGYPTVDDWLKALKYLNESSEGFIGNKLLYLYHIQVDSAFSIKCETQHILEG